MMESKSKSTPKTLIPLSFEDQKMLTSFASNHDKVTMMMNMTIQWRLRKKLKRFLLNQEK